MGGCSSKCERSQELDEEEEEEEGEMKPGRRENLRENMGAEWQMVLHSEAELPATVCARPTSPQAPLGVFRPLYC